MRKMKGISTTSRRNNAPSSSDSDSDAEENANERLTTSSSSSISSSSASSDRPDSDSSNSNNSNSNINEQGQLTIATTKMPSPTPATTVSSAKSSAASKITNNTADPTRPLDSNAKNSDSDDDNNNGEEVDTENEAEDLKEAENEEEAEDEEAEEMKSVDHEDDNEDHCYNDLIPELQQMGFTSSTIVVPHQYCAEYEEDYEDEIAPPPPISSLSLGDASYVDDLLQQREEREVIQQEEIMGEAYERYNQSRRTAGRRGGDSTENIFGNVNVPSFLKIVEAVSAERQAAIEHHNRIQDARIQQEVALRWQHDEHTGGASLPSPPAEPHQPPQQLDHTSIPQPKRQLSNEDRHQAGAQPPTKCTTTTTTTMVQQPKRQVSKYDEDVSTEAATMIKQPKRKLSKEDCANIRNKDVYINNDNDDDDAKQQKQVVVLKDETIKQPTRKVSDKNEEDDGTKVDADENEILLSLYNDNNDGNNNSNNGDGDDKDGSFNVIDVDYATKESTELLTSPSSFDSSSNRMATNSTTSLQSIRRGGHRPRERRSSNGHRRNSSSSLLSNTDVNNNKSIGNLSLLFVPNNDTNNGSANSNSQNDDSMVSLDWGNKSIQDGSSRSNFNSSLFFNDISFNDSTMLRSDDDNILDIEMDDDSDSDSDVESSSSSSSSSTGNSSLIEIRHHSDQRQPQQHQEFEMEHDMQLFTSIANDTEFWGREKELRKLRAEFMSAITNTHNDQDSSSSDDDDDDDDQNGIASRSHHVWISGVAGIGKSKLVDVFLCHEFSPPHNNAPFICRGTFDENKITNASNPYQGITSCFVDLFEHIIDENNDTNAGISLMQSLQRCFNDDDVDIVTTLSLLIPNVVVLLPVEAQECSNDEVTNKYSFDKNDRFLPERLSNALARILKSVCVDFPVIFSLDDIHNADEESLQLLSNILSSTQNLNNFFFIGSHRVVKVTQTLPKMKVQLSALFGADMKLDGIDVQSATSVVLNQLLRLHNSNTNDKRKPTPASSINPTKIQILSLFPLLESWYSQHFRSSNPLFLNQFIHLLYEQKKIKFKAGKWKLTSNVVILDSVSEILAKRLDGLPKNDNIVLQSAALLDTTLFNTETLLIAIKTLSQSRKSVEFESDGVEIILDKLCTKKIITKHPNGSYAFHHDTIRGIVSSRIPGDTKKLSRLHFRLATNVKKLDGNSKRCVSQQTMDNNTNILIADHLQKGIASFKDKKDKIEMFAKLYLQLAEKSMKRGLFIFASQLLDTVLAALNKKSKWVDTYQVCLKIHLTLARCLFCSHDFDRAKSLLHSIIANRRSPRDTISAFDSLILIYRSKKQYEQAKQCTLKALRDVWDDDISDVNVEELFVTVRKKMQSTTDADLLVLSDMEHKKTTKKMPFLLELAEVSGLCRDYKLQDIAALRMVELTLKFGSYEINFSGLAFALCGLCVARRNLHGEACRYGRLAEMMSDVNNSMGRWAIAHSYFSMRHWRISTRVKNVENLMKSCWVSINENDLDHLSFQVGVYVSTLLSSGLSFDCQQYKLINKYNERRKQYNIQESWYVTAPYNALMRLKGETARLINTKHVDTRAINYDKFFIMVTSVFMNDIDRAEKLSAKIPLKPGGCWDSYRAFMVGLISTHYALMSTGVDKFYHEKEADKSIHILRTWAKKGLNTCAHMANILQVELKISSIVKGKKTPTQATAFLDTAIRYALRDGFLHHAALASERAGLYFLFLDDEVFASKYLSRAYILYKEWGAYVKVKQLASQYESLLKEQPDSFQSSSRNNSSTTGILMFTDDGNVSAPTPRRKSISEHTNGSAAKSARRKSHHAQTKSQKNTTQHDTGISTSGHSRRKSLGRMLSFSKRRSKSKEKAPNLAKTKRTSLNDKESILPGQRRSFKNPRKVSNPTQQQQSMSNMIPLEKVTRRRMSLQENDEIKVQQEKTSLSKSRRRESSSSQTPRQTRLSSGERNSRRNSMPSASASSLPSRKNKKTTPLVTNSSSGERNSSRNSIPSTSASSLPLRNNKKKTPLVTNSEWGDQYDTDDFNTSDDDSSFDEKEKFKQSNKTKKPKS